VIRLVVKTYVRFPLSLRDVEDLLFERGIDISHETVRYWWNRFGPMFAADRRQKFALWCLLFTLGHAPDVDDSFDDRETRDLARQFMELTDLSE
jgi:hypothetical protein